MNLKWLRFQARQKSEVKTCGVGPASKVALRILPPGLLATCCTPPTEPLGVTCMEGTSSALTALCRVCVFFLSLLSSDPLFH
jgi:hypothetical protein